MKEKYFRQMREGARAFLAAVFCFAVFVFVCNLFSGTTGGGGLVIRTPDNWYDGVRVSLTALLASAMGTLAYRRPYSRPMVGALAVGLVFLSLDPMSVWEQVSRMSSVLPAMSAAEQATASRLPEFYTEWMSLRAFAMVRRVKLYWVHYIAYLLWTVVTLYSGYLGQYLVGLTIFKKESRKESAIYVAENAGVGLAASLLAGVAAILLGGGPFVCRGAGVAGDAETRRLRMQSSLKMQAEAQQRRSQRPPPLKMRSGRRRRVHRSNGCGYTFCWWRCRFS